MYNPITKAARYLRREYPFNTAFTSFVSGLGLVVAGVVTLATGGLPLWAVPAIGLGVGGFGMLFNMIAGGEIGRPNSNRESVNGLTVVGSTRDVASVVMTQKLIDTITEKKKHLSVLPERTKNRIQRHIDDICDAVARLRVYQADGSPSMGFTFVRDVIGSAGKEKKQVAAFVAAPLTAEDVRAAHLAKLAAAKETTPAPAIPAPGPAQEFSKLSARGDAPETPSAPDTTKVSPPAPGRP